MERSPENRSKSLRLWEEFWSPPWATLDGSARCPTSMLAKLYHPLTMPAPLLKAHQQLDGAVDRCCRPEPFPSDRHGVEYLFALYEQLTAPLVAAAKPVRKGRRLPHPLSD
ncbi:MAG: type IIL restriction-modification enzyme MmeI, partial [Limisphaerales bacterium]